MAILRLKSMTVAATDVLAPLSASDLWVRQFIVQNPAAASTVYLGGVGVTSTTGLAIVGGSSLAIDPNKAANSSVQQMNLKDVKVICAAAASTTLIVLYLVEEKE